MKFRYLAVALVLACAASGAFAQGALYVNPTAVRATNSTADNSVFAFLGQGKTSEMLYGVTIGGYYDLPLKNQRLDSGFEVGLDVRDAILHGNNAMLNSFLVGPRLAYAVSPRFHPYVEPFIGAGSTRAPNTTVKATKAQFGAFVGADFNLNRIVTFRAIEVGYSSLTTASGETIGATETIPAAKLLNISTGFTFRIP